MMKMIKRTVLVCAMLIMSAGLCIAQGKKGGGEENERWNSTPNDINNLMKSVKGLIDADYSMEVKTLGEINPDPEQNPVLYYTGHYNYEFTPQQREMLRKFMLEGGMVIFNTGLGSMPFYRSTVKELGIIFPEEPLQRLSADHPLFHAYYQLDRVQYSQGVYKTGFKGNEPWIDGVTINCRTVAIVSRFCMAVGWDGGDVLPDYAAYMPESAQKMGVNIFAYATASRAWAKNMAHQMKFIDKDQATTGKMSMVQVMYDGIWKTRHAGISVLLQTFNRKTEVPVKFGLKEMPLSNDEIFNAPLIYLTGHEYFRLKKADMENLKKYITNGGFLFAEACCGRKGFDLSFREIMRELFPESPLQRIDTGSSLFQMPNVMTSIGVTPQLSAQIGNAVIPPFLEGVDVDGHYGVIYSKYGMSGGWEMSQSPYAYGYNDAGSIQLGQNILMYAITQ